MNQITAVRINILSFSISPPYKHVQDEFKAFRGAKSINDISVLYTTESGIR